MSKIPSKFLNAIKDGQEFPVRYRWGEHYEGDIEWLDWDKGVLCYVEKANDRDEPGVNILDETGWGYAGREKDLEASFFEKDSTRRTTIFGRYGETAEGATNQHLLQVEFLG